MIVLYWPKDENITYLLGILGGPYSCLFLHYVTGCFSAACGFFHDVSIKRNAIAVVHFPLLLYASSYLLGLQKDSYFRS